MKNFAEEIYEDISHIYMERYRDGMTPRNMQSIAESYFISLIPSEAEGKDLLERIIENHLSTMKWDTVLEKCISENRRLTDLAFFMETGTHLYDEYENTEFTQREERDLEYVLREDIR